MRNAPDTKAGSTGKRSRGLWAMGGGVLVALIAALALAVYDLGTAPVAPEAVAPPPRAAAEPAQDAAPTASQLIDDDGHTLWASPTNGPPLTLASLPAGMDLVLALRPAAMMAHPEGEKVVAALGPLGAEAVQVAEATTGKPFREMERLLVGWQVDRNGRWRATILDTPTGAAPPLPRDMERLLERTDADRHATLLIRPAALVDKNRGPLTGPMTRLRDAIDGFLGDGMSAAAVSLHWDDDFFAELIGIPTLDVPTHQKADELAERLEEAPDRVEEFVVGLAPTPHGRRVVARFPGMVRKLAAYTRHDYDADAVTFRCYLPAVAGHNLLMGAELTLAEARAAADGRGMIE